MIGNHERIGTIIITTRPKLRRRHCQNPKPYRCFIHLFHGRGSKKTVSSKQVQTNPRASASLDSPSCFSMSASQLKAQNNFVPQTNNDPIQNIAYCLLASPSESASGTNAP